jgi:hypothetical protein
MISPHTTNSTFSGEVEIEDKAVIASSKSCLAKNDPTKKRKNQHKNKRAVTHNRIFLLIFIIYFKIAKL